MNQSIKASTALPLILLSAKAFPEIGCPPGMIPYQGLNAQSCGPIPTNGRRVSPKPSWSSRWGAIAQDPTSGMMGVSNAKTSKSEAGKTAIADCLSHGGARCRVETFYTNQCVAVIQGVGSSYASKAESDEVARRLAMDRCTQQADTDCHVYYKACSRPVRVR